MATISYDDFEKIDLRSGTIVKAESFPQARKPAYKIWADFGPEFGVLQTSAQVTLLYTPESLVGRPIVGCINLGEKNIAGFLSQFLLVGFSNQNGAISLVTVDSIVPNGQKLH
ncbi:tRNA-binding protein [Candidatus Babeliales bacterium]|nr:tRNA-binding protein [Candidatus Babeliales bacterium]MBP9843556.1 tRNA-binding protein [Candidatus Babeliales bacterium]